MMALGNMNVLWPLLMTLLHFQRAGTAGTEGCGECCDIDFEKCTAKEVDATEDKMIVCYFTNWAWSRPDRGSFKPENIDPSLCTHINYALSILDGITLTLRPGYTNPDINMHFYEHVTAFKANGVKVLLVIGIWKDTKWNRMISNDENRATFVASVLEFIKKYNFDGVNLGFLSPACPSGNREYGQSDKENHSKLLKELKAAFNGQYYLTIEFPSGKSTIDSCFGMTEVCELVDWVNVASYGYHGNSKTDSIAPICGSDGEFGVYNTIKYYMDEYKCPASKMTLGIPFYGATYTMETATPAEFGVSTTGSGAITPFLKMGGYTTYYESCQRVKDEGWQTGFDKLKGDFIYKEKEFVSTPSVADVNRKSCLIRYFNLKGANFWTLDYDDFNNMCDCGEYPLLKALNKQLRGLETDINCPL